MGCASLFCKCLVPHGNYGVNGSIPIPRGEKIVTAHHTYTSLSIETCPKIFAKMSLSPFIHMQRSENDLLNARGSSAVESEQGPADIVEEFIFTSSFFHHKLPKPTVRCF